MTDTAEAKTAPRESTQHGGPAFPLSRDVAITPVTDMYGRDVSSGMSLRDYFAGQALMCIDPSNVREYELRAMFGDRGGGFNNALSRLRTLELISGRGELKASDDLFSEAA